MHLKSLGLHTQAALLLNLARQVARREPGARLRFDMLRLL
jgi:hypothetical protein